MTWGNNANGVPRMEAERNAQNATLHHFLSCTVREHEEAQRAAGNAPGSANRGTASTNPDWTQLILIQTPVATVTAVTALALRRALARAVPALVTAVMPRARAPAALVLADRPLGPAAPALVPAVPMLVLGPAALRRTVIPLVRTILFYSQTRTDAFAGGVSPSVANIYTAGNFRNVYPGAGRNAAGIVGGPLGAPGGCRIH